MQKLTLGQQLSPPQILKSIQIFVHRLKSTPVGKLILFKHKFGSQAHNISSKQPQVSEEPNYLLLDREFISNCIQHCVMNQLRLSLKSVDVWVPVTDKIQDFYFRMSTDGPWRTQFNFQQSLVYLTKVVAEYYKEMFTNLSSNSKLESEIFIILIYSFMGMKIGEHSFALLEKKHLIPSKIKVDKEEPEKQKNKQKADLSCSKEKKKSIQNDRRITILKKNLKKQRESFLNFPGGGPINRNRSSFLFKASSTFLKQKQVCEVQEFKQSLRQSLYIDPLPRIKKAKKSIESFSNDICSQLSTTSPVNIKSIRDQQNRAQKKCFVSTQLSFSMKSEIQRRHVSIAEHNRSFKIKHRPPFLSGHTIVFKNRSQNENSLTKDKYEPINKQNQESYRHGCKQWREIIRGIRDQCRAEQSLLFEEKTPEQMLRQELKTLTFNNRNSETEELAKANDNMERRLVLNKVIMPDLSASSAHQPKEEGQRIAEHKPPSRKNHFQAYQPWVRLDSGTKNYKQTIPCETYYDIVHQKQNKQPVRPKQIKTDKKNFDLIAKQRNYKMQYSMFMLPSMRNKLNF